MAQSWNNRIRFTSAVEFNHVAKPVLTRSHVRWWLELGPQIAKRSSIPLGFVIWSLGFFWCLELGVSLVPLN